MDIRDAMAEAILRDVLANPGKYPPAFVRQARNMKRILSEDEDIRDIKKMSEGWPASTDLWIHWISEYQSTVLPGELPDQKPESEGEQCPDARNLENKE